MKSPKETKRVNRGKERVAEEKYRQGSRELESRHTEAGSARGQRYTQVNPTH